MVRLIQLSVLQPAGRLTRPKILRCSRADDFTPALGFDIGFTKRSQLSCGIHFVDTGYVGHDSLCCKGCWILLESGLRSRLIEPSGQVTMGFRGDAIDHIVIVSELTLLWIWKWVRRGCCRGRERGWIRFLQRGSGLRIQEKFLGWVLGYCGYYA